MVSEPNTRLIGHPRGPAVSKTDQHHLQPEQAISNVAMRVYKKLHASTDLKKKRRGMGGGRHQRHFYRFSVKTKLVIRFFGVVIRFCVCVCRYQMRI